MLRWFEPSLVSGLLQTEAYARAVLEWGGFIDAEEVEQRVRSRMERQAILAGPKPPQFFAILDEAVLWRCVGSRSIMAEQCEHLIICAGRPHIHIQVVPYSAAGHAGLAGGFILAKGPNAEAAHLDNPLRAHVVDQQDDIDIIVAKWESIRVEALPPPQTLDLIKEALKSWQT